MKTTLSVIKADIGSIGGHEKPSKAIVNRITEIIDSAKPLLISDYSIFSVGDDNVILMVHKNGVDNPSIHKLAWDAFTEGTKVAKSQGLYGAGQDMLINSFSGNVKGLGPGSCEMEFEERPNEPFLLFMCDKTNPGVFNLPFFRSFADPFHNAGFLLSTEIAKGFEFTIMDVTDVKNDRIIVLNAPQDYYDLATLLRDPETYVIESIRSRANGDIAVVVSTSRLHNIAGTYTGKDDPVALVRSQKSFPSTGEILSPWATAHFVAGDNRGSHHVPVMPVKLFSTISFFDGPAIVQAAGFCVHDGKLTEYVDLFDHPFWRTIQDKAARKFMDIREQGFFNPAMVGMNELEYTGVVEKIKVLNKKFKIRKKKKHTLIESS
ncbi:fructose 1,6-bisphosphatase [Candidatus Gottesmanbacteria bacterium]|nr:fructose 1,6-bisphosphatase [Candidatus Gottesmanbacteria bacterium]